jgi:hypothetical protein
MELTVDDNIITAYGPQFGIYFAKRHAEKIKETSTVY